MGSSIRVLSGSLTKGSTAVNIGDESATVDLSLFKQGHNIHTFRDLSSGVGMKIRSHTDMVRTLSGRKLSETLFDDTMTPMIVSGSSAAFSNPSVSGRFEYHVQHNREKRDLGQTDTYIDGLFFTELDNPDNALNVLGMIERGKKLPQSMVDSTSLSNFDGKIDVLGLLKSTDGSTTEFPFNVKGVSANFAQNQDFLKRSSEVSDKTVAADDAFVATSFYMDAPENFGNVLVPSVMNFNNVYVNPFKDVESDVEDFIDRSHKFEEDGDEELREFLKTAGFTVDDARGTFDRMTVGGFDYEGGDTDSISFGGLKR